MGDDLSVLRSIRALRELLGAVGCPNYFRGCDGLAYMTLRVIGNVDQKPADRRGKFMAAYRARLFQVRSG